MVALDGVARSLSDPAPACPPCPRWLQGIAHINRLRSGGQDSSGEQNVSQALSLLCMHGMAWRRLEGARMLASVASHDDRQVIDALLGNSISSAGFGMNDKASEVRAAAATTLGELARDTSNPAVIDALIDLFRDSDWTVRSSALQALSSVVPRSRAGEIRGEIGGSNYCVEKLLECLGGAWSSRVLGAQALGNIAERGDTAVVSGLAGALSDDDWAVQKAAATSIGMVATEGDSEALEAPKKNSKALIPLLHDADWRVRKTALVAIGNVAQRGCRRAIDEILLRLDDTLVAAPQRLDQNATGVLDVRLTAIDVIRRLALRGDRPVLGALMTFKNSLSGTPQEERLYSAVVEACEEIMLEASE